MKKIVLKLFENPNVNFAQSLRADNVEQHTKQKKYQICLNIHHLAITWDERLSIYSNSTIGDTSAGIFATLQGATTVHTVGLLKSLSKHRYRHMQQLIQLMDLGPDSRTIYGRP